MRPVYEAVFERRGVGQSVWHLDVGCVSGMAARPAVERGAQISGSDALNRCVYLGDGRSPTRRIACNTSRGAIVILPRNTTGVVIAKGLRSPDRDGNCRRSVGLNTSERYDILPPVGLQRGAHPHGSSAVCRSRIPGPPSGGGAAIRRPSSVGCESAPSLKSFDLSK